MKDYGMSRVGRGFSLVELVAVLAVVVSVGAVLGPSVSSMRSQMRGVSSEGNLANIGQVGGMYAVDSDDRIFSFTWQGGESYFLLHLEQFRTMPNDQEAASRQVQNILHRATGRISGQGRINNPSSRLMHRRYSHLVLADYLGGNVTDPMWVDPADANQLHWQLNPLEYLEDENSFPYGYGMPNKAGYDQSEAWAYNSIVQLWPFASSYQVVPHAWLQDFGDQYHPVDDTPHLFSTTGSDVQLGERQFHEVRFPSAKVHMFEEFDREQVGSPYFAYDHAQSAKLMFDGSINTMASGLSQLSVSPELYLVGDKTVWEQRYVPLDTFPVPLGGLGDQTRLSQRFRWTLGGLQGVNYPQTLMRGR